MNRLHLYGDCLGLACCQCLSVYLPPLLNSSDQHAPPPLCLQVGKPDIAAGNAIVHAINRVLLPVPLPGAGANSTETAETTPEGTETTAPEGTEVAAPTGAASGLMASAAAVAASLVAAAFLA